MQIQNNHNVSFGAKVPTKQLVDFVSGIRTEETNELFLNLTGLTNEKMLSTMNSDTIEFAKSYCSKQVTNTMPIFSKLTELRDNLFQAIQKTATDKSGGQLRRIAELFDAKDAEKASILNKLPESVDLPEIKLPL